MNHNGHATELEVLESRLLFTAAPLITEFLASNDQGLEDEDGNSSDWIEIYNAGDTALDLDGWHLTDNSGDLTKWAFPSVVLDPSAYLVVFASGEDRAVAGSQLHTNFKLGAGGEYLALTDTGGSVVHHYTPQYPAQSTDISFGVLQEVTESTLIAEGADARYTVPTGPAAGWNTPGFDDSGWDLGPTAIGYETSPADFDSLIESAVPASTGTVYLRQQFNIASPDVFDTLELKVRYDDGFVAYLNGVEVAQMFAPASPAWNSTTSTTSTGRTDDDSIQFQSFDLTGFRDQLVAGDNVLAIQVFNTTTGSSDLLIEPVLLGQTIVTQASQQGFIAAPTPGALNNLFGPIIGSVTEDPPQPIASQSLLIEAAVSPNAGNGIARVDLHYRINFDAEQIVQIFDNGQSGDQTAGDGVYSGRIFSSQYDAGDLVRWYVTAEDDNAVTSRAPLVVDTQGQDRDPEYFGTVVADPSLDVSIPLFQWFTQDSAASLTRVGTRASVFFNGEFYDNVFVRLRGSSTAVTAVEKSQKFDFNNDHKFFVNDKIGRVEEININGPGSDGSRIRQTVAFHIHEEIGNAASDSTLFYLTENGSFDRIGVFVEQPDDDFLERNGLDADGELYKFTQRSGPSSTPTLSDVDTGVERKTGDKSDLSSVQTLSDNLQLPTAQQRENYIFDQFDIAQFANYVAVRSLIQHADDIRKNYYLFLDTQDTGQWSIIPWDLDWTFGIESSHGPVTRDPFAGDSDHRTANGVQWNVLWDVLFESDRFVEIFGRRLRTLMDTYLGPPGTSNSILDQRVSQALADYSDHLSSSEESNANAIRTGYLVRRRGDLYNTYGPTGEGIIPAAQPASPALAIGAIDFNPAGGDQDQEYIELVNNNAFAIDISGWTVEGAISHTFTPGTAIGAGESLYITASSSAFRTRVAGPTGGQGHYVQQWGDGHLSSFGETITIKRTNGTTAASKTYAGAPSLAQQFLRITEVHYNPQGPTAAELAAGFSDGDLFEFIEFTNTSGSTLDLNNVHFDVNNGGVTFAFGTGASLSTGQHGVLVSDLAAFQQRYGTGVNVLGTYTGNLSNGGEQIKLEDATNSTIQQFKYEDGTGIGEEDWPTAPDGAGSSLVVVDTEGDYDAGSNWAASITTHGTPGEDEAATLLGDINGDGMVNGQDLAILAANFGLTGQTLATGDVTGDGNVNGQDLAVLAANFGASADIATATNPGSGNDNPPAADPGSDANNNARADNNGGNAADDAGNNAAPPTEPAPPTRPTRDAPLSLTRVQQRAAAATPHRANALALAAPVVKDGANNSADSTTTPPAPRARRFDAMALR